MVLQAAIGKLSLENVVSEMFEIVDNRNGHNIIETELVDCSNSCIDSVAKRNVWGTHFVTISDCCFVHFQCCVPTQHNQYLQLFVFIWIFQYCALWFYLLCGWRVFVLFSLACSTSILLHSACPSSNHSTSQPSRANIFYFFTFGWAKPPSPSRLMILLFSEIWICDLTLVTRDDWCEWFTTIAQKWWNFNEIISHVVYGQIMAVWS